MSDYIYKSDAGTLIHRLGGVAGTRRHGQREQQTKPYDRVWRRLRLAVLSADPLCAYCAREGRTTLARVVDHIVPVREAPERRLDPSNLQPLCVRCHVSVKAREEKGRVAGRG